MSIQQEQDELELRIGADEVEEYLSQNPEFFETHSKLLSELKIPHNAGGSTVSLIERQVDVLRQQNKKQQKQLSDLLAIARDNDKLSKQVFKLTLSIVDAPSLAGVFLVLNNRLHQDFNADAVSIRLLPVTAKDTSIDMNEYIVQPDVMQRLFEKNLKEGRPVCGRLKEVQRKYLFGSYSDRIQSLALLPLCDENKNFGLLAIGSQQEYRFHSGKGTVYLNQMSKIISKTVLKFITAK